MASLEGGHPKLHPSPEMLHQDYCSNQGADALSDKTEPDQ